MDPELERWNGRFSAEGFLFGTGPNAFLASQAHRLRRGMRALCVADGEGRNGVWLASQGLDVTTFDFSPVGVAKARTLAKGSSVHVDQRLCEASEWVWEPDAYDVVAAIFVQFAAPALRKAMFAGMESTLKPGGLLILQGYRTEQLGYGTGGPKAVENLYTEELLKKSFPALEIVHLAAHDEEVDEGPGHRGMSALVDLVGRRR